jgi:hypothetical protein
VPHSPTDPTDDDPGLDRRLRAADPLAGVLPDDRSTVVAEGAASHGLIVRLIIQTILLGPSGAVWIDDPTHPT